jgi:hypothetical protein
MRTLIVALTALMLFATTPVAAGDWEDGLAAYDAGDYQKALRLWKPLAKWGVYPQVMLGWLYNKGEGVPVDHAKAVYWYTKAAKQGHATAQYHLGLMYAKGDGVPKTMCAGMHGLALQPPKGMLAL